MKSLAIAALLVGSGSAHAERPIHGSVGIGSSVLLTGDDGDRTRFDVELDLEPHSRFGGLVAVRAFDRDHRGIACVGLVYEAAAARPVLVLDLHADAGIDLDQRAPMVGGGLRTTLAIAGPLGIGLDSGGYLVIDGVDKTRLALSVGAAIVARW